MNGPAKKRLRLGYDGEGLQALTNYFIYRKKENFFTGPTPAIRTL